MTRLERTWERRLPLIFDDTANTFDFPGKNDVRLQIIDSRGSDPIFTITAADTASMTRAAGLLTVVLDSSIVTDPDLSTLWTKIKKGDVIRFALDYRENPGEDYVHIYSFEIKFIFPGTVESNTSDPFTFSVDGVTFDFTLSTVTSTLAAIAAQSALANATDATTAPTALAMASSTFFARLATGGIVAATVAQIKTLLAYVFGDISGTLGISQGGTGQTTQQAAIDALTNVSGATDEQVLTKDTGSGNAVYKDAADSAYTVLKAKGNQATVLASATFVEILNFTIPGGTLGTSGYVSCRIRITIDNVSSAVTCTVNITWGASSIFTAQPVFVVRLGNTYVIDVNILIGATGATGQQYWNVHGTGSRSGSASFESEGGFTLSTVDSTVNQTLDVEITLGNVLNTGIVRLVEVFAYTEV